MDETLTWRPEVLGAIVGEPADREQRDIQGRRDLKRLNPLGLIAAAGHAPPVRVVPGEFYAVDVNDGGISVAVVGCPCKTQVTAEVGVLTSCGGCQRMFLFLDTELLCFLSPERAAEPVAVPA